jgi:hypothetical protein
MGASLDSSQVLPSFRGALSVRLVIEGTIIIIVPLVVLFLLNVLLFSEPFLIQLRATPLVE